MLRQAVQSVHVLLHGIQVQVVLFRQGVRILLRGLQGSLREVRVLLRGLQDRLLQQPMSGVLLDSQVRMLHRLQVQGVRFER